MIRLSNTRVFSAADVTKLDGIEASADVTDAANVAAAGAVMDGDFAGSTLGRMTRTGVATYAVVRDNLVGAAAPAVTDDSVAGYGVGSMWFDTTAHRMYVCDSAAVGAAIWIGSSMKDNVFAGAPAVGSDNTLGYSVGSTWIDTVTAIRWKCQSAATGAAVWNPEVKNNFAAAVDPVVGDDTSLGYAVGSLWINTTAVPRRIFACTNPAAGTAVWRQINALNNLAAAVAPIVTDDTHLGYDVNSVWIDTTHNNAYICLNPAVGAAVWRSLGAISQHDSRQIAATSEPLRVFRALAPGRIVACSAETNVVAAAAEDMTFDVHVAGATILDHVITVDSTIPARTPVAGVLGAAPVFAAGDEIVVVRVYTPGGGPTPMSNTVCDVLVQYN